MDSLIALMTAAVALMATPGPVTLGSAAAGAAFGLRALPYVVTLTSGTVTVMVLVAAGITGLLAGIPGAAPVISGLAGGYILYLAYRIATAPPLGALDGAAALPSLAGGYAFAVVNPKAYGAMGALFSGFPLVAGDPLAGAALKVLVLSSFALTVNITWMLAGTALARIMRDPRASRALNVGFAVMLLVSVVAILRQ